MRLSLRCLSLGLASGVLALVLGDAAPPTLSIDLRDAPDSSTYTRYQGAFGNGRFGVPVCGGHDCDGDGLVDVALSAMTSSPFNRNGAGQVTLVWGTGTFGQTIDTGKFDGRFLQIAGAAVLESAGSEIWMDDVDGDGLGDLLIGRQNYTPPAEPVRRGAGALTILFGGPELRAFSRQGVLLDLRAIPANLPALTIVGRRAFDRLGIWMRTGDVDGDGVQDLAIGADEADSNWRNTGEVYVVRGGDHLRGVRAWDLASLPEGSLAADVVRVLPPPLQADMHFGATVQLGDLDNDGRAELLVAATVERAGAGLRLPNAPAGTGQATSGWPRGRAYIVWDEWFDRERWSEPGYEIHLADASENVSVIDGGPRNLHFGEELLGGGDFDGDGRHDLMLSDLAGLGVNGERAAGRSVVFFEAARVRNREFGLEEVPPDIRWTEIIGPVAGALSGDAAALADFDQDGLDDLVLTNPHDNPLSRLSAGSLHVLYGKRGAWPRQIDLRVDRLPRSEAVRSVLMVGARGSTQVDRGDTLAYSLAVGDVSGDGVPDMIFNEMLGNGAVRLDTGNLVLYSGAAMLPSPNMVPEQTLQVTRPSANTTRLRWQSSPNLRYGIEVSEDLIQWDPEGDMVLGTGVVLEIKDITDDATRWYRVFSERL